MKVGSFSRESVDWAIGVLDRLAEGKEGSVSNLLAANAALSAVSVAAFDLAERIEHFEREYIKAQSSATIDAELLKRVAAELTEARQIVSHANEALLKAADENERLAVAGEELEKLGASLQGQLDRLRPYADPRLFAAASDVLAAFDDAEHLDDIGGAIERLAEAVAWWDGLAEAESQMMNDE